MGNLVSQPLCDRTRKSGIKNKHKQSNGTMFVSLCFIPLNNDTMIKSINDDHNHNHPVQLIGLMKTLIGRETGRYDLVYYGTRKQIQKSLVSLFVM